MSQGPSLPEHASVRCTGTLQITGATYLWAWDAMILSISMQALNMPPRLAISAAAFVDLAVLYPDRPVHVTNEHCLVCLSVEIQRPGAL